MRTQRAELNAGGVLGRYELLLPVAKGGMGQVWAGRLHGTRGFQKLVAIKTLLPTDGTDKQLEKMLLSEAALASRIKHPNVVEGLDLGEQDGTLYFVMEWVSGEALDYVLKASAPSGGLPLPILVHIAAQACSGLQAAHDAHDDAGAPLGLVHRDVSPQNLLIGYAGTVKLTDFGVAKATQQMSSQGSVVGQVKGKFPYMSPEQVRGAQLDGRSDIFAMGVVLYRMLTGKHPFKGQTPAETLGRILSNQPPPRPSTLVPSLPATLDAVVMRALAADRSQRFPTAREMRLALESALPGTTPPNEHDLEALMIKLFGRRLSDRRHALTSAAAIVDAKDGVAMPAAEGGPSQARSQSTMRAVMVSVSNAVDIVLVGDGEVRSDAPELPPQAVEPAGMPSLDLARIRPSSGTELSAEEQAQISSSVMPPPIEPTGSTWLPLPESRRSSRRRSVVAIGASAVLALATLGLVAPRFRLTLGVHDSGSGVSAAVPLAREPAAPAPSMVAADPNGDPSRVNRAEPGDVDAIDAGPKMAAPSLHAAAPPTVLVPRSATPGSRDRRGVKGGGDSDKANRRTDHPDPTPADPTNPPAWDPLRARK